MPTGSVYQRTIKKGYCMAEWPNKQTSPGDTCPRFSKTNTIERFSMLMKKEEIQAQIAELQEKLDNQKQAAPGDMIHIRTKHLYKYESMVKDEFGNPLAIICSSPTGELGVYKISDYNFEMPVEDKLPKTIIPTNI